MRLHHGLLLISLLGVSQEAYQVPEGAYRIETAPEAYRAWHEEAQKCSVALGVGAVRPFEEIDWWAVPGPYFALYGADGFAGFYDSRPEMRRIYVLERWMHDKSLIKHESLHHALDPQDGHPEPPFAYCESP